LPPAIPITTASNCDGSGGGGIDDPPSEPSPSALQDVAPHLELKAKFESSVSYVGFKLCFQFQALSTQVSSVPPAPPYQDKCCRSRQNS
jgi:hypothetical protein